MDFNFYYDLLKNLSTEELSSRQDDEQYVEEYRYVCKKIIESRAKGEEQEPNFNEEEFKEEINDSNEFESIRKVPESIDECCKMDKTSKALYMLSKNVEKWGFIILILLLILGVAVSIMNAAVVEGYMVSEEVENVSFDAGYFLSGLSMWVLYAIIEYWVYRIISLLLAALGSIVYSNRITSNISLYTAKK